jgi:hypothetical protein
VISCISLPRTSPHPLTGDFYEWSVAVDGREIPWQSYAGPLRFDETEFAVGTVGGKFGDTIVAAVQDINPESDGCFILARVHGALSHDRRGRCDTRSHSGRHGECRENPLVGIEILNSRTALRGNRRRTRTLGDDRHICANVHASRRASPDHGANACYVATVWHLVKPTAERTTNCSGARPVSTARQPTGGAGGIPGDDGEITIAATK